MFYVMVEHIRRQISLNFYLKKYLKIFNLMSFTRLTRRRSHNRPRNLWPTVEGFHRR